MKRIIVNIKNETVTTNGNTCNFEEAGLTEYDPINDKRIAITEKDIIDEYLVNEKHSDEEILVIFE